MAWTFRVYLPLRFCLLFQRCNSHIQNIGFRFKAPKASSIGFARLLFFTWLDASPVVEVLVFFSIL